jgi:hypothetical protein
VYLRNLRLDLSHPTVLGAARELALSCCVVDSTVALRHCPRLAQLDLDPDLDSEPDVEPVLGPLLAAWGAGLQRLAWPVSDPTVGRVRQLRGLVGVHLDVRQLRLLPEFFRCVLAGMLLPCACIPLWCVLPGSTFWQQVGSGDWMCVEVELYQAEFTAIPPPWLLPQCTERGGHQEVQPTGKGCNKQSWLHAANCPVLKATPRYNLE